MIVVVLRQNVRIFRVVNDEDPCVLVLSEDWLQKGDRIQVDNLVEKIFESVKKNFYPTVWKEHGGFFILESELRTSLETKKIVRMD